MKYVIVYFSRFGNGKKLVEYLVEKLKEKGAETHLLTTQEANPIALPDADCYIFSAPAEALNLQRDMRDFMRNLKEMDGKKYGIINTHGMKKNRLGKMERLLTKKKMIKGAKVDFQVGQDAQTGNGLREGWKAKIDEFAGYL